MCGFESQECSHSSLTEHKKTTHMDIYFCTVAAAHVPTDNCALIRVYQDI